MFFEHVLCERVGTTDFIAQTLILSTGMYSGRSVALVSNRKEWGGPESSKTARRDINTVARPQASLQ